MGKELELMREKNQHNIAAKKKDYY